MSLNMKLIMKNDKQTLENNTKLIMKCAFWKLK